MSNLVAQVFHIAIYIQPIHFVLAIITNVLNISVLYSHTLRKSPCTYYFLAYAVFSIIYSCLLCPTQILRSFSINWITGVFNCKISTYLLYLIPFQANFMLNLASFDRYCSSSQSYARRSLSARRKVNIIIIISTILLSLYIQSARAKLLTVSIRRRRTERQLSRMLLFQIIVHVILILPFGIIYYINILKPSTRTPNVLAIRYISVMWQQCDYFVSFFLYVFSGRVYRQELNNLIRSNGFKSRRRQLRNDIQQFTLIPTSMLPAIIAKDVFL
ncbi:unnamed protein product [Adineta steineri]|uniref:G-protein coupled receptors family 1 profile domain-containing protein n=1 Tax=Adineta steineri TaxID=433720 RepID=A0A813RB51_9BILA|nr:unnamed protein product [Adineta steineri]